MGGAAVGTIGFGGLECEAIGFTVVAGGQYR